MALDRRSFLRAAGATAAGVALATGAAASAGGEVDRRAAADASLSPLAGPTRAQWAQLAASLTGSLVRDGQPAYGADRLLYSPKFDGLRPLAIAYCATPTDVARTIAFARTHGVALAVRAGGHSYGGYSSGTGRLVVDVTTIRGVVAATSPGSTARVGAGARLIDVYNTLGSRGQLVPGGSCPSVGIAGLTLGGGVGVFARRYGLAADNVAAITMVSAAGEVLRCTPSDHEALYWACRGGGGGNFGVVTEFEFTTHAVPPVTLFTYDFDWSAAHDLLGAWQHWTRSVPDEVWSNCQLLSGDGTSARVAGVACGSPSQTRAWLAPLLAEVAPTYSFVGSDDYVRAMMVEAGCASLSVAACHLTTAKPSGELSRQAFTASSNYVAAPMGDAGLAASVAAVDHLASELPSFGGGLVFDALGGAVNRVAPSETAFVHRSFLASIQSSFSWGAAATPSQLARGAAWLETVRRTVYDEANGAYQNYIDPTQPDFARAYYGSNLPRLSQVKRAIDPDSVFSFAQSIP